jgi:uncharacterized protein
MPPRLDREAQAAGPIVQGFAGKGFRVDGAIHAAGLWLTPLWALDWNAPALENIAAGDVETLLAFAPRPEFLLLGTGPAMRRPPPAFVSALEALEIGVEPMDSRAAARAWGVLRAEGRWIVAALLPLGI